MHLNAIAAARIKKYLFVTLMVALMVAIAEFTGEKEVIFPEITALTIGAWISAKQPWAINKRKMFFLTSLASLVGVCVVRYMPLPLIVQIAFCFVFAGAALTISRTSLLPIISACVLPVYLGTTSWIYPISVTLMLLIIITAQWQMEKLGFRYKNQYKPCQFNLKSEFTKWVKLFAVLMIIACIPVHSRILYIIAPPLIVVFAEFANVNNKIRKKPLLMFWILAAAAFLGTAIRIILNLYLHLPLAACTILACLLLFVTFEFTQTLFPPAGAILLLPMILQYQDLKFYPLEVAAGSAIFISAALIFFQKKAPKSKTTAHDSII